MLCFDQHVALQIRMIIDLMRNASDLFTSFLFYSPSA